MRRASKRRAQHRTPASKWVPKRKAISIPSSSRTWLDVSMPCLHIEAKVAKQARCKGKAKASSSAFFWPLKRLVVSHSMMPVCPPNSMISLAWVWENHAKCPKSETRSSPSCALYFLGPTPGQGKLLVMSLQPWQFHYNLVQTPPKKKRDLKRSLNLMKSSKSKSCFASCPCLSSEITVVTTICFTCKLPHTHPPEPAFVQDFTQMSDLITFGPRLLKHFSITAQLRQGIDVFLTNVMTWASSWHGHLSCANRHPKMVSSINVITQTLLLAKTRIQMKLIFLMLTKAAGWWIEFNNQVLNALARQLRRCSKAKERLGHHQGIIAMFAHLQIKTTLDVVHHSK